jgi:hypothetical protein
MFCKYKYAKLKATTITFLFNTTWIVSHIHLHPYLFLLIHDRKVKYIRSTLMDLIRQICLYILIDINVNINQSLWFDLLLFVFIYIYCCQICFDMLLCSYYVDFVYSWNIAESGVKHQKWIIPSIIEKRDMNTWQIVSPEEPSSMRSITVNFTRIRRWVLKQKFDDNREVIKSHKSKKDKQHNGQKTKRFCI